MAFSAVSRKMLPNWPAAGAVNWTLSEYGMASPKVVNPEVPVSKLYNNAFETFTKRNGHIKRMAKLKKFFFISIAPFRDFRSSLTGVNKKSNQTVGSSKCGKIKWNNALIEYARKRPGTYM